MKHFIRKHLVGCPPPRKFLALLLAILLVSHVTKSQDVVTKPITNTPITLTKQKLDSTLVGILEKTQNQTLTAMQLQGIYALFSRAKAHEMTNKQGNIFADLSSYKSKNIIPLAVLDLQYEIANNTQKSTTSSKNYFAVSPLSEGANGLELQFILPKTYLLKNSTSPEIHSLEVDFADGKGYKTLNIEQAITINYEKAGFKKLQFQYQYKNEKGKTAIKQASAWLYVQSSTSKGKILNSLPKIVSGNCYECLRDEYVNEKCIFIAPIPDNAAQIANLENLDNGGNATNRLGFGGNLMPDEEFTVSAVPRKTWTGNNGVASGDAFLFKNCEGKMKDPIVIVECFDEKNRQGYEWGVTLFQPFMKEVLKRGYSVVLVNFRQSGDYIENNGLVLRNILQELQLRYGSVPGPGGEKDYKEIQAVIGQSMGGQVARYELRKMHNDFGASNVKNYISLDSPHRGANIPLGMQWMLSDLSDQLHIGIIHDVLQGSGFGWLITLADETKDALYWPSAKQMIKYHIGDNSGRIPSTTFNEWQTTIQTMGFPQRPRNIAIVNGDLFGRKATDLLPLLGQKVIEYEWSHLFWIWGFIPNPAYSEGYAHFSPPASQTSSSRISFVYMNYDALFGNVSQVRNSFAGMAGYDATVGSYYETQKEVKQNLQQLINAGAIVRLTNNVDRHTFIPSNSAANFEPPAGVNEDSDAYLETSLVNQNIINPVFPYQVLDANRIKGFVEVHPGVTQSSNIPKLQGNIWHLDTKYLEDEKFIDKYFPEFRTDVCPEPYFRQRTGIGITTRPPECIGRRITFRVFPEAVNATHYKWYVNGSLSQEFGGVSFTTSLQSEINTISVEPCSWFTNSCGTSIGTRVTATYCGGWLKTVNIYPNPAENLLNIDIGQFNSIQITDIFGRTVATIDATEQRPVQINTSNLANGIYFVKIVTENEIFVEKIIIQK